MLKKVKKSALILALTRALPVARPSAGLCLRQIPFRNSRLQKVFPRRRDCVRTFRECSEVGFTIALLRDFISKTLPICREADNGSPSPWGEGRGEGGRKTFIPLHRPTRPSRDHKSTG